MTTRSGHASLVEESTVVDVDIHLSMNPEQVAAHLEEPHRSHLHNPTFHPFPVSGWNRTLGGKIESQTVDSPESVQRQLCEGFHIDVPVINATSLLPRLPQSDLAVALMQAYDDLLLEEYLDDHDHFRGLATIATQQPDEAAEELDRIGDENQIVGAYIATTGPRTPLGDPRYDVIYEAAQDNDLAIFFHASGGAFQFEFPRQNQAVEKFFEVHTLAHPWSQMMTMTSLIANGTPEKFPDLDFVFLEAGLSWVPYMMFRLNKEYSIRRSELPLLERSPEEYIREFYFASQPVGEPNDPRHLQQILDMVGAESILFATDFPHWDFDHPEALAKHLRANFSEEECKAILGGNAIEALDLGV